MSTQTHAIVIGGSMAGLLASWTLSDHFDTVTIIERDTLPENPEYRSGTPQAHHLHTLLAYGQRLLENMFPNIEDDFENAGAIKFRWGLDTPTRTPVGWMDSFDAGIESHVMSRVTLEWIVRQRVYEIPNVTFMTQQQVNRLLTNDDQSKVIGVNMTSRTTRKEQDVFADLVVDTSGRGSKAMQWLEELGYTSPEETVINSYLGYATRWYEIPEGTQYNWKILMINAVLQEGLHRGGGMFIVEGNRIVVTVAGVNKDYPSTDEDGFMAFAASLADTTIYDVIKDLKPISPIYGYRRTENRFRHYEKLSQMPHSFIVMGDAVCGFNPIYGQGMTSATIQATELNQLLAKSGVDNLIGNPLSFQKRVAKAVDGAWLMATGEDMRYPETEGATLTFKERLTHTYMNWMISALQHDPILGKAFIDAMNLIKHPISLFNPKLAIRVLRHRFFGQTANTKRQTIEFKPVKTQ